MLEYCPHCGHTKFMQYRHGDQLMCRACGAVVDRRVLMRTRVKVERERLIVASVWLAAQQGDFTRAELARHLQLSNSPHFRQALDDLVSRGLLTVAVAAHPQNNRPTNFYRRPGRWLQLPAMRPCWAAGAVS